MRHIALGCLLMTVAGWLAAGCVPPPKAGQVAESNYPAKKEPALDALFAPPSPDDIPGDQRGEQIRLGFKIVANTQEYGQPYAGNRLNCTTCHLDAALNPNAASVVGLSRLYPEYRARADRQVSLADRINECFERSLNGTALPPDSSKDWRPWSPISTGCHRTSRKGVPSPGKASPVSPRLVRRMPSMARRCSRRNVSFAMGLTGKGRWPRRLCGGRIRITSPQGWRVSVWRRRLLKQTCRAGGDGR